MNLKLERIEQNYLIYALGSVINYLKDKYEKLHQEDILGKSPDYSTPLEKSSIAAFDIIKLETLIKTVGKVFKLKIEDTNYLLKDIKELKNYISPDIIKEKEEEEKKWFEENPERKNNLI